MPTNAEMLGQNDHRSMMNNMEQINSLLARTGTQLPQDWAKMQPQDQQKFLQQLAQQAETAGDVAHKVDQNAEQQEKLLGEMQNMGVDMHATANRRVFNLKKESQLDPTQNSLPTTPPAQPQADPNGEIANPTFSSGADVKDWLESIGEPNQAIKILSDQFTNANQVVTDPDTNASGQALQVIKDAVSDFFSTSDEQSRLKAASLLFDTIMPDGVKQNNAMEQGNVPAKFDTNVHSAMVDATYQMIKKLAKQHAEQAKTANKKAVFNLKKEAQHQSVKNVILFGPGQNRVDAFTGQLISDWHLVERNKGFGLRLDDVYDIDFESIWRGTIMDKYSRPYRDKDGTWVGGYLQGRFESDKNIPIANNMQLKPGEKRKPILREYGTVSSRLEKAREDGAKGDDPAKFFNLKKARTDGTFGKVASMICEGCGLACAAKTDSGLCPTCEREKNDKKKVEAQIKPLDPIGNLPNEGMKLPGDAEPGKASNPKCNKCGGNLAKQGVTWVCPNCHNNQGSPEMSPAYQQSMPQQNGAPTIQKNQVLASGIFYSGGHFVVHASNGKMEFDTFEEAEKHFAQAVAPNLPKQDVARVPAAIPQKKKPAVQPKPLTPHEIEKAQAADKLGIDG